jgi:hypothetical protein
MARRSAKLTNNAVVLHTAAATLAAPSTVAHGASIAGWRQGINAPQRASISIDAAGSLNLTGAIVCGWNGTTWRKIETLDATIALTATLGFEVVIDDLGALYTRLAVTGTLSASTVTITATPIEVTE